MANNENSGVLWFAAGAILGASAALLYAPKKGKDTRRLIGRTTSHAGDAVSDSGKELVDRGRDLFDRGRKLADEAAELFERGRQLVRG